MLFAAWPDSVVSIICALDSDLVTSSSKTAKLCSVSKCLAAKLHFSFVEKKQTNQNKGVSVT